MRGEVTQLVLHQHSQAHCLQLFHSCRQAVEAGEEVLCPTVLIRACTWQLVTFGCHGDIQLHGHGRVGAHMTQCEVKQHEADVSATQHKADASATQGTYSPLIKPNRTQPHRHTLTYGCSTPSKKERPAAPGPTTLVRLRYSFSRSSYSLLLPRAWRRWMVASRPQTRLMTSRLTLGSRSRSPHSCPYCSCMQSQGEGVGVAQFPILTHFDPSRGQGGRELTPWQGARTPRMWPGTNPRLLLLPYSRWVEDIALEGVDGLQLLAALR